MKKVIALMMLLVLPLSAAAATDEVFINPPNPDAISAKEKEELRRYQVEVVQYLNQAGADVDIVRRGGNLGLKPKNKTTEELIAIVNKKVKKDGKKLDVSTINKLPNR
jgi:hypothetical protein